MNDEASRRQDRYRRLRRREDIPAAAETSSENPHPGWGSAPSAPPADSGLFGDGKQSGDGEQLGDGEQVGSDERPTVGGQSGERRGRQGPRTGPESSTTGGRGIRVPPSTDPGNRLPPAASDPHHAEGTTTENRYSSAVAAMNQMLTTMDLSSLPWVTEAFRTMAGALDKNDATRPSVLNNLGTASKLAHLRNNDPDDLNDAISYYRAATSDAHSDDQNFALYASNLVLTLTEEAVRADNAKRARDTISTARWAVDQTSYNDPRRGLVLIRLANALKAHARLASDPGSDDESIDVFRAAARASSTNERVDLLVNLGSALLRRYERRGSIEDLDEGIDQLRAGIDGLADGEPRRIALCHLASALRVRFHHVGDLSDLHEAINELTGVITLLNPGHQLIGKVAWNLACAAAESTDSTGEAQLLRHTLQYIDPALRGMATDDPDRSMAYASFGALLRRHYQHGAPGTVLDSAVAVGEAAFQASSRHGRRYAALNSYAHTLIARYEYGGDLDDLDRASSAANEASEFAPSSTTPLYTAWIQLGVIATHRFRSNALAENLDTSIEMFDRALTTMPDSAPGRAAVATQLGRSLRLQHQRHGRRRPYRWARKVLAQATGQVTSPADQRLRAASLGGRLAAHARRWPDALESFTTAVELLPLVTLGKRVVAAPGAQQRWATLTSDAAACALECGQPERAVELLEHGRAAILADFLPTGGELGRLHRDQPDLADRAVRLRRLLDRPEAEPTLVDIGSESDGDRRRLVNVWEALLGEIRAVPGHENHLRIQPFSELSAAGSQGPVVLVNISQYRSDALVVYPGRVVTVPLPDASHDSTLARASALLTAVEQQDTQELDDTLDWLWHCITRPVLDRLGYQRASDDEAQWPRMWWCVTGALSFLPVHAATALSGDNAIDRVVSSYTPTLGTLLRDFNRPIPSSGTPLLAAGSPDRVTRELPPEAQVVTQYWPTAELTHPGEPAETLQRLPMHPWIHSCETSTQYPAQPASSVLFDREQPNWPIGLVEIGPVSLDGSEFCYLGRCETVVEEPSAAASTIPAALGFAGFTHVIGSLWNVEPTTAARLHAEIYKELFGGGVFDTDFAAHAVHTAVSRLRAAHPTNPANWAAHIHIGP